MDIKTYIEIIGAILVPLVAIGGSYLATRVAMQRVPFENVKDKADALQTMQDTLDAQAKTDRELRDEINELIIKIKRVEDDLEDRDKMLLQRDHLILDYQDWLVRLVHQVKSYDKTPVPFISRFPDVPADSGTEIMGG